MIVLTGTTGGLGSCVLRHLLNFLPPQEIIISRHNPAPLLAVPDGVQVRHADYGDPHSLDAAFCGADSLFLVSYPSIDHEIRAERHKTAIDAAKRSGIKRIWYTSLAFADGSVSEVMKAHLDTEAYLKFSGLTYTIIREGIYAEYFPAYLGFDMSNESNDIYVAGDGKVAWVSREDLGEATARLIAADTHKNTTVLFSGPESNNLNLLQLADLVSRTLGRVLRVHVVTVDEYVSHYLNVNRTVQIGGVTRTHVVPVEEYVAQYRNEPKAEWNGDVLRQWAKTYVAMEMGETERVSPLLEELLGRPARSVEEVFIEQVCSQNE